MPIPDANRLIVAGRDDPRVFVVEKRRSNVIQMSQQGEQTLSVLVIPDFDLVIVATADEERLGLVEMDASDGPVVFVELVDQRLHAVVPQLDDARVQRGQDPRPLTVEGQAFHSSRFRFEFRQHDLQVHEQNGEGEEK